MSQDIEVGVIYGSIREARLNNPYGEVTAWMQRLRKTLFPWTEHVFWCFRWPYSPGGPGGRWYRTGAGGYIPTAGATGLAPNDWACCLADRAL